MESSSAYMCLAVDKFTFGDLVGTCVHAGFSMWSVYVCGKKEEKSFIVCVFGDGIRSQNLFSIFLARYLSLNGDLKSPLKW